MLRCSCRGGLLRDVGLFQGPVGAGEAGVGHREAASVPGWV